MRFVWNEAKNKTNIRKHGITFETAREVFDDPLHLSLLDEKLGYFEERWITVGAIRNRAIVVVAHLSFTVEAEEVIRIISAREATARERKQYETYG